MFDHIQYEKEHLIRLYKSGQKALNDNPIIDKHNLKRTVGKWIDTHKNTPHIQELKMLIEFYESI